MGRSPSPVAVDDLRRVLRPVLFSFLQIDAACVDRSPVTDVIGGRSTARPPVILMVFARRPDSLGRRFTVPIAAELHARFGWPFVVHVVAHRGDPMEVIGHRPVVFVRGRRDAGGSDAPGPPRGRRGTLAPA